MTQNPWSASRLALGFGIFLALAGFSSGLTGSPSVPSIPQEIEASWSMADAASGSAADGSGNGALATLQNGATFGQGKIGRALSLDGVDDSATVAPSDMAAGVSEFSVAGWINIASLPANGEFREILSISIGGGPSNSSRIAVATRGDGTAVDVFAGARTADGGSMQSTTANLDLGISTWHHLVASFSFANDSIDIWLDGVLAHSATVAFTNDATPATTSESIAIGAQDTGSGNEFHGLIDELKVFSRALTQAEIEELADGLGAKLLLHFEDPAGPAVADSSINAEDGTLKGDAQRIPGPMGSAILLDGDGDYIELMADSQVTALINEVTVSAWVRIDQVPADGTFQELVSLGVNSPGGPTATSRVAFALRGDSSGTADIWAGARSTDTTNMKSLLDDANLQAGEWTHLAATLDFDSGVISTFVNGVLSGTTPAPFEQPHTPNTPGTNGAIGAQDDGSSNHLAGAIDCVRVYCKALTASEIQRLVIRDGQKGSWPADDLAGSGTLADISPNGNSATLQGDSDFVPGLFGNALQLDGDGDAAILPSGMTALADVEAMSYSGWVNLDSLPASGSFMEILSVSVSGSPGTNSSRLAVALKGDGGGADVFVGARDTDSGGMQSTTATNADIQQGVWTHIAATVDIGRDLIRIFKDGALIHSATVTYTNARTPNTPSTNSAFGAQDSGTGNPFHGKMDAMMLYCRALTATEVAELATLTPPPAPQNLVATPGDGLVTLRWDAVAGASSYNAYRSTDQVNFAVVGNTTFTTFTDSPLTNGTQYFFKVKSVNAAGESVSFSNEDDATPTAGMAPAAPVIISPADGSIVMDPNPTVTGTSSDVGLTIEVLVDGASHGTTTSAMGGAWSLVLPTPLTNGYHNLQAVASENGESSPPSTLIAIIVDADPPTDTDDPTISQEFPSNASVTNDSTPHISAKWSDATTSVVPGSALILLDGNDVTGLATLSETGFSLTPSPLNTGSRTVTVSVSDIFGNVGTLMWSFSVASVPTDQSAPAISGLFPSESARINDPVPTITGTVVDSGGSGVDQDTVAISLNGILVPVQLEFSDINTLTFLFTPTVALAEGQHSFSVVAGDVSGNVTGPVVVTFSVDSKEPRIDIVSPAAGSTQLTTDVSIHLVTSDEEAGVDTSTLEVILNENVLAGLSVTDDGQGGAIVTANVQGILGNNSLTASITDLAGNESLSASQFVIAITAPDPIITSDIPNFTININTLDGTAPETQFLPTNRSMPFSVRASVGGVPQEAVTIEPVITSGSGEIVFTDVFRNETDANGVAGFVFRAPQRPGTSVVEVMAGNGITGQSVTITFEVQQVSVHVDLGAEFPGSGTRAFITTSPGVGRTAVHLQEVEQDGTPITDPGQKRFSLFNTVYTTEPDETLVVPLLINPTATGIGYLKATLPEFEDSTGTPVSDTGFSNIQFFLDTPFFSRGEIVSGNGQVADPDEPLTESLVAKVTVFIPQPGATLKVIDADILPPGDPEATIEAVNGNVISQDPLGKSFRAIVTSSDDTLSIKYTPGPSGKVGLVRVIGFESDPGSLGLPSPANVANDVFVVQQSRFRFVAVSGNDKRDLRSVPVTPSELVLDPNRTVPDSEFFFLEGTFPVGTPDEVLMILNAHDAAGNLVVNDLSSVGVRVKKQQDGVTWRSTSKLQATTDVRTRLFAFQRQRLKNQSVILFQVGETVRIHRSVPGQPLPANAPILGEFRPSIRAVTTPRLPLRLVFDQLANGKFNIITENAVPDVPEISSNLQLVPNFADLESLEGELRGIQRQRTPDNPGLIGQWVTKKNGVETKTLALFEFVTKDLSRDVDFELNPTIAGILRDIDLVITLSAKDENVALPTSTVILPVRVIKKVADWNINYHTILTPGQPAGDQEREVRLRLHGLHRLALDPLLRQAGVTVGDFADGSRVQLKSEADPGDLRDAELGDPDDISGFQKRTVGAGPDFLLTMFMVDTISGGPTGDPSGATPLDHRQPDKRRMMFVRKVALRLDGRSPIVAHELCHILGLRHVNRARGDEALGNLMLAGDSPLRISNALVRSIDTEQGQFAMGGIPFFVSAGIQHQLKEIREKAPLYDP